MNHAPNTKKPGLDFRIADAIEKAPLWQLIGLCCTAIGLSAALEYSLGGNGTTFSLVGYLTRMVSDVIVIAPLALTMFRGAIPELGTVSQEDWTLSKVERFLNQLSVVSLTALLAPLVGAVLDVFPLSAGFNDSIVRHVLQVVTSVLAMSSILWSVNELLARPSAKSPGPWYLLGATLMCSLVTDWFSPQDTVVWVLGLSQAAVIIGVLRGSYSGWLYTLSHRSRLRLLAISGRSSLLLLLAYIAVYLYWENYSWHMGFPFPGLHASTLLVASAAVSITRIFVLILLSIPTSKVIDRRNQDLAGLSALFEKISVDAQASDLIELVAVRLSGVVASHSYICVTNGDDPANKPVLPSSDNARLVVDVVQQVVERTNRPVIVASVAKVEVLGRLLPENLRKGSLMYVPILADGSKRATIILLKSSAFDFSTDDIATALSYQETVRMALEYLDLLQRSLESERIRRELDIARGIQQRLVPSSFHHHHDIEIAVCSKAALEVGGDYYEILETRSGKTLVLIGDVSGKGMSAALYMSLVKGMVLAIHHDIESPSQLLSLINAALYRQNDKRSYLTLSCLLIDSRDSTCLFARGGHLPLAHLNSDGLTWYQPSGLGLGLAPPHVFDGLIENICLKFEHNETLFVLTDGVSEAMNSEHEEFGMQRVEYVLSPNPGISARSLLEVVQSAMDNHLNGLEPHDDATFMAIQRKSFTTRD